MNKKEQYISRLELFSTITFWVSIASGVIFTFAIIQSCSKISDLGDSFGASSITSVLNAIILLFMLIVVMIVTIGITVSIIAKVIALKLKAEDNIEFGCTTTSSKIKEINTTNIESKIRI